MRRGSEWWKRKRGLLRNGCSVTVWRSMKDIERKCGSQAKGGGSKEDVKF